MLEVSLATMPWGILALQVEGREPARGGSRSAWMSPHGVFPAAGDDQWVAVAVEDDERFARLAEAIGQVQLAGHPRFRSLQARKAHEDELDGILAGWTQTHSKHEAADILQAAGVAAWPVMLIDEIVADESLRGFFVEAEHPEAGRRILPGPPWRASLSPMRTERPAPLLGQHTVEVLSSVLGMPPEEIARLEAAGVLE
jgi:crotonobetainyl-CoA:carnitine CoA-transferase CaiB-like acyl-CoA transferase